MIKHYFKVALRNLFSNKIFTLANLLSLSLGLTFFFLFLLYYRNELRYDQFDSTSSRVYRVYEWAKDFKGSEYKGYANLYLPLGPALKQDVPGVRDFLRMTDDYDVSYLHYGDKIIKAKITYADASFFTFFPFPFLSGGGKGALEEPNDVVLSGRIAQSLFGKEAAVGKVIHIVTPEGPADFTVTGVTDDLPNSSISFQMLAGMSRLLQTDLGKGLINRWDESDFENYVLMDNQVDANSYTQTLVDFRKKYFPGEKEQLIKSGAWNGQGLPPISFRFQPLADVHRNERISSQITAPTMDGSSLWIFFAIAAGVLLIGCVNFTTLAIGRSSGRSKEIGVRKVLGAQKQQILQQFLGESVLLSVLSGLTALLLAWLILPTFNSLMLTHLGFQQFYTGGAAWIFIGIIILASLLAGFYPSLVLSGLKIVEVFKKRVRLSGSNFFTRGLMTFQYALSMVLIIGTVVMLQQLNYIRNMDVGFNKDNVIVVDASAASSPGAYDLFKQSLANSSRVLGVTSTQGAFGRNYNGSGFDYQGKHHSLLNFSCDVDFLPVMGMHLRAGRNLMANKPEDTVRSVIVNEAFAVDMGMSDSALLGMKLEGYSARAENDPVVVGVVGNFNLLPVQQQIKPLLFRKKHDYNPNTYYVHVAPGNISNSLDEVRTAWNKSTNGALFDYTFMDEYLYAQYAKEQRLTKIVGWAGSIGILLAMFGLAGIAYLTSENRLKELTIRKVFGASWAANYLLVANDFLKLVLAAFLVAIPASIILMNQWLSAYAYRIQMQSWTFVTTTLLCLVLTYVVILVSTIKLLFLNPITTLKTE